MRELMALWGPYKAAKLDVQVGTKEVSCVWRILPLWGKCTSLTFAVALLLLFSFQRAARNLPLWRGIVEAREAYLLAAKRSYREFYRRVDALWNEGKNERALRLANIKERIYAGETAEEAAENAACWGAEDPIHTRTRGKSASAKEEENMSGAEECEERDICEAESQLDGHGGKSESGGDYYEYRTGIAAAAFASFTPRYIDDDSSDGGEGGTVTPCTGAEEEHPDSPTAPPAREDKCSNEEFAADSSDAEESDVTSDHSLDACVASDDDGDDDDSDADDDGEGSQSSRGSWSWSQQRLLAPASELSQRFKTWTDNLREDRARLWSDRTLADMIRVSNKSRVVLSEHILFQVPNAWSNLLPCASYCSCAA
jgi:hypothetical protein